MPDPSLHAWLEIAYFASGVLVAAAALLALLQLVLARRALLATQEQLRIATEMLATARDDVRVRSEREAVAMAAQRCEKFAEQLLPRHNEQIAKLQAAGVRLHRWQLRDAEFNWKSFEHEANARDWVADAEGKEDNRIAIMAILNDLEALAIYFVSGAASEKVAYPVIGALFCAWVEIYAPHIAMVRTSTGPSVVVSDVYPNVVSLYKIWAGRRLKARLEADANRINLALSGIDVPEIRPIGTDGGA